MPIPKAEPPSPSPEHQPPPAAFQAYQPIPQQTYDFFLQSSTSQDRMAPHGAARPFNGYMLPTSQSLGHCGTGYNNVDASGVETKLLRGRGGLVGLDMNTDVVEEEGVAAGAVGNGVFSHSGESGGEGASKGSNEKCLKDLRGARGKKVSDDGNDGTSTDLNIGMDYLGATTASQISSAPIQDERELKRQKRKMSNREAARRFRVKKQVESENLTKQVARWSEENAVIREELNKTNEAYNQLLSQSIYLQESVGNVPRGTKDSEVHESDHCSGDNNHQETLDSDAQTGKPKQSGY